MKFTVDTLIPWLYNINEKGEDEFVLQDYVFYNNSIIDVQLRISHDSFDALIPLDNIWVKIYSLNNKKQILKTLVCNGLKEIKRVYGYYDLARKIIFGDLTKLEYHERVNIKSFFSKQDGCKEFIKIWKIERVETEVTSNMGKDNTIHYNTKTFYGIVIFDTPINDHYLQSLLPENTDIDTTDHGYIPSSPLEISYNIGPDKDITESILQKYNSVDHYKSLLKINSRQSNSFDAQIFRDKIL